MFLFESSGFARAFRPFQLFELGVLEPASEPPERSEYEPACLLVHALEPAVRSKCLLEPASELPERSE